MANVPVQLPNLLTVVMNGGLLKLATETIGSLSMNAGSTVEGQNSSSTLTLNGDLSMSASPGLGTLISMAHLVLRAPARTFTVTGQPNQITARIGENAGPAGLIKTGPGTLSLAVPGTDTGSTYTGLTTVSEGVLDVSDVRALGSTAAGTVVNAGAALRVNFIPAATSEEPLTLSGTGIAGTGALIATGTTTWSGAITLAADAAINTSPAAATLTVSSLSGTGELVKIGPGELRFTGAGSSRPSRLRAGTLLVQAPHQLAVTLEAGTLAGTSTVGGIAAEGAAARPSPPD